MPWYSRDGKSMGGPSPPKGMGASSITDELSKGICKLTDLQAEQFVTDVDYSERLIARLRRIGFRGRILAPVNLIGKWHGQCLYRFPVTK